MQIFSCISRADVEGTICFEETYRYCYNLVLHNDSHVMLLMLRLTANAMVRNLPRNKIATSRLMLKDLTLFYSRLNPLNGIEGLIAIAYQVREAWAMRVLQRVPSLWREYYLRPGSVFAQKLAEVFYASVLEEAERLAKRTRL